MRYPIVTIGALQDLGFGIIVTIIKRPTLSSAYGKGLTILPTYSLN
jgi:hypothetical protein